MFSRAIVVLLVTLNLGVALWWIARPAEGGQQTVAVAPDAPRLFLLSEVPANERPMAASARPAPQPVVDADNAQKQRDAQVQQGEPVAAVTGAAGADGQRCFALGPFGDAAAASRAQARLQSPDVKMMRVRQVAPGARGWSVAMAPLADRAAAIAVAGRLREAGFEDLFILSGDDSANGIALGRYGNESSARQRVTSLKAAGFDAVASAIGDVDAQHWIDVTATPGFDATKAQQASGAARAESRRCAAQP